MTTILSLRKTKDQDQGNMPAIDIHNKVWVSVSHLPLLWLCMFYSGVFP